MRSQLDHCPVDLVICRGLSPDFHSWPAAWPRLGAVGRVCRNDFTGPIFRESWVIDVKPETPNGGEMWQKFRKEWGFH